ncbi:hypothetical protein [Haloferula sp.]|uniref:hypothetical protein n=1 Tax=Haloferula sp. TaxID=2497595 RepID=UPI003C71DBD5
MALTTIGASGQFVLIDDFANGDTITPPWVAPATTPSPLAVVPNPANNTGQVLAVTGVSGAQNIRKATGVTATGGMMTLYFEFYVASGATRDLDLGFSLTDLDEGGAWGDFCPRIQFKNSSNSETAIADMEAIDGGNGGQLLDSDFLLDTWYGVWMVIDDAAKTWQFYAATTTTNRFLVTSGSGALDAFGFQRNNGADALDFIYMRYSGGNNGDVIYLDNIYVDELGVNSDVPNELETNLALFVDSDMDLLDDNIELLITGQFYLANPELLPGEANLDDLTGLFAGPGPGAGSGDFDGDGLSDLEEVTDTKTNPMDGDSDDDGLSDLVETNKGPDSYSSPEDTGSDPNKADTDADGISDGNEVAGLDSEGNTHGFGMTDPTLVSTDGDSLADGWEVDNMLDPLDDGSFGETEIDLNDGPNGDLGDPDDDKLGNLGEFNRKTLAQVADTDDDGYNDYEEDGTGFYGFESFEFPGLYHAGTDPLNPDTDNDKILDGWENPDHPNAAANQAAPGPDMPYWSDPNIWDTDGDQFSDGTEVLNGSDPDGSEAPVQTAGFKLLENFEGPGMTIGQTFNGVNGWRVSDTANLVAEEPIAGGDAVGSMIGAGSAVVGLLNSLDYRAPVLSIVEGQTGTIFLQLYSGTVMDSSYGLSDDIDVPSTGFIFANLEPQFSFNTKGVPPYSIGGRDPGGVASDQVDLLVDNSWYDIWIVVNNQDDTYQLWVKPAGGEKTQVTFNGGETDFVFRNGQNTRALINVLMVMGGATTGTGYFDNLYVDPIAANTEFPDGVISKPATPEVSDLKVTSVTRNEAGDVLITFSPGGAGYVLTSSPDLSLDFELAEGATYDGVDTFTVPAASLGSATESFFRVEDAP